MRTVILSKKASNKLIKLLDYLKDEWSLKVRDNFITKFDKSIKQIQDFPESCKETDYIKGLRIFVITKQTSIIYKFNSETITIVVVFDNRMNPSKK